MTSPGRPPGPHTDTEQDVLNAALRLLTRYGPAALGPTRVSRESGVGRSTIDRNWPTRDDLIAAAVEYLAGHLDPLPTDDPVTVPGAAHAAAVALERKEVRAVLIAAIDLANRGAHPHALERIGDVLFGPIALAAGRHGLPLYVDDAVAGALIARTLLGPAMTPGEADKLARRITAPYPRRPAGVIG